MRGEGGGISHPLYCMYCPLPLSGSRPCNSSRERRAGEMTGWDLQKGMKGGRDVMRVQVQRFQK